MINLAYQYISDKYPELFKNFVSFGFLNYISGPTTTIFINPKKINFKNEKEFDKGMVPYICKRYIDADNIIASHLYRFYDETLRWIEKDKKGIITISSGADAKDGVNAKLIWTNNNGHAVYEINDEMPKSGFKDDKKKIEKPVKGHIVDNYSKSNDGINRHLAMQKFLKMNNNDYKLLAASLYITASKHPKVKVMVSGLLRKNHKFNAIRMLEPYNEKSCHSKSTFKKTPYLLGDKIIDEWWEDQYEIQNKTVNISPYISAIKSTQSPNSKIYAMYKNNKKSKQRGKSKAMRLYDLIDNNEYIDFDTNEIEKGYLSTAAYKGLKEHYGKDYKYFMMTNDVIGHITNIYDDGTEDIIISEKLNGLNVEEESKIFASNADLYNQLIDTGSMCPYRK